ncbi:MAG: site-specific DNA-methyltransferase [Aeriscardovia sp.]|nr:site-specific DNA-methyltransferase [Aeriscardovia sp.]
MNNDLNFYINKIIEGNCIDEIKKMPAESVDLVFADPPYFMQTDGILRRTNGTKFAGVEDEWDKFDDYAEYDDFTTKWLIECKRVMKKNASIWIIGSFQNIYRLGYIMQNMGFWILNDVIWSKPNAVPNFGGTRFQNSHETLLWCTKSRNAKYTFNYKTMKYLNNGKQEKSVWNIGICTGTERLKDEKGQKVHSTQKPEELLYKVIISSSKPGDLVLDPFFGTGTTGVMAKATGRNYVGFEREKKYIKYAQKRLDSIQPVLDDVTNLKLEVKPPKVPMIKLMEYGYIRPGQKLYSKDGSEEVTITATGYVNDGVEDLSIHKMSAKMLGLVNNNGWSYFWVKNDDGEFVTLDSLRYRYQRETNL